MEHFHLSKEFCNAGFFETEASRTLFREIKTTIEAGHLVALTGIQGSGKTETYRRLREELLKEQKILVSTSLALDKDRVTVGTLIEALYADLIEEEQLEIPDKAEIRKWGLEGLIRKQNKPIALFVDEAHELHPMILVDIKRLLEVVRNKGGVFSIVLIGLPKLVLPLRRPAVEAIGTRVHAFELELISGREREFIEWLVDDCTKTGVEPTDVFTPEAMGLLAENLKTPLQIIHYGWQALELAWRAEHKVVGADIVQAVLASAFPRFSGEDQVH